MNSPWGEAEKAQWLAAQCVQRSYQDLVVRRMLRLAEHYELLSYGALSYAPESYPLYLLKSFSWDKAKPTILITGGVHGYETSGVMGALRFLETEALRYSTYFNLVVAPCVSPWGFETINRWNPYAVDPNRSFKPDGTAEEALLLMRAVTALDTPILAHLDLHETTDTDNTIFRPALAARDGIAQDDWDIPDGFYLVGDADNPADEFQRAIIEAVEQVTHIAPADEQGRIIGKKITQPGVINYRVKSLGLCAAFSHARYCTTTEVYPDSPKTTSEICERAQVVAVCGGLGFLISDL